MNDFFRDKVLQGDARQEAEARKAKMSEITNKQSSQNSALKSRNSWARAPLTADALIRQATSDSIAASPKVSLRPQTDSMASVAKSYRGLGGGRQQISNKDAVNAALRAGKGGKRLNIVSPQAVIQSLLNPAANSGGIQREAQRAVDSRYGGAINNLNSQMGQNYAAGQKGVADTRGFYNQAVGQNKKGAADSARSNQALTASFGKMAKGISGLPGSAGSAILAERNLLGGSEVKDVGKTQSNAMAMLGNNLASTGAYQAQNVRSEYAQQGADLATKMQDVQAEKAEAAREMFSELLQNKNNNLLQASQFQSQYNADKASESASNSENLLNAYQLQKKPKKNPYDNDRSKYQDQRAQMYNELKEGGDPDAVMSTLRGGVPKRFQKMWREEYLRDKYKYYRNYNELRKLASQG
jgi:hypothetical protein